MLTADVISLECSEWDKTTAKYLSSYVLRMRCRVAQCQWYGKEPVRLPINVQSICVLYSRPRVHTCPLVGPVMSLHRDVLGPEMVCRDWLPAAFPA